MERTLEFFKEIAKKNDWKVNPSEKTVLQILKLEKSAYKLHGVYLCPCKPASLEQVEITQDKTKIMRYVNECPCMNAQKEIDQKGYCHCNLFWRKDRV